jgi:hypothetical protein
MEEGEGKKREREEGVLVLPHTSWLGDSNPSIFSVTGTHNVVSRGPDRNGTY